MLSLLVFEENVEHESTLSASLEQAKRKVEAIAKAVGAVQVLEGIVSTVAEYIREALKPGMMEVVVEWCNGRNFAEICLMTDIQGSSPFRLFVEIASFC